MSGQNSNANAAARAQMAELSQLERSRTAAATTLNDLPECVLIHIISFLPLMAAIRTSFISRNWRNLWHFIPNLEFYLDQFNFSDPEQHLRLINTINRVLLNRPATIPFRVFRLTIRYFPNHRHRSLISSWLRYALNCGVEDFSLCFYCEGIDEPRYLYDFHFSDLINKPVKYLSLFDCMIVMPDYVSSRFNSLRKLKLVRVNVVDELLTNLISKCVNLEELCLNLFDGVRNFRICSKSLKVLKLLHYYKGARKERSSVEMCTPNLSKIKISDFFVASFMGDLYSVNEAELLFSGMFKNSPKCWGSAMDLLSGVENLKIRAMLPRFVVPKFESNERFHLERLKHLELMPVSTPLDVSGVSLLLERSPALETLAFGNVREVEMDSDFDEDEDVEEDDGDEHEEDGASGLFGKLAATTSFLDEKNPNSKIRFHIPSLNEVKMLGFRNTLIEHMVLLLLEKHKVVLNKVVVVPANLGEATVVLDPKSEDLHNFWLRCMTDKVAKAKREICCLQQESVKEGKN